MTLEKNPDAFRPKINAKKNGVLGGAGSTLGVNSQLGAAGNISANGF